MRSVHFLAEEERFELSIPFGIHAFQACALGHYATLPNAERILEKEKVGNRLVPQSLFRYTFAIYRAIAQLVARVVRDDEVVGSNPTGPTNFYESFG